VSRRATSFPLPLLQISADCPQPAPYWVVGPFDLLRQDLDRRGYKPHAGTLSRLRDDLVYLQHSHRIEKIGSRERDSQPAIGSGLASFS
jgi:hypothetical protein